jgi:hypothetical protein
MSVMREGRKAAACSDELDPLEAVVIDNVMGRLGRPPGLHRLQCRRVFGDSYRVNVFVADGAGAARIAHSYFLVADGDGTIHSSSPLVARVYALRGAGAGQG